METYKLTPLNQKKKVFSYLYKKKKRHSGPTAYYLANA